MHRCVGRSIQRFVEATDEATIQRPAEGGDIRLQLQRLVGTDAKEGWARGQQL